MDPFNGPSIKWGRQQGRRTSACVVMLGLVILFPGSSRAASGTEGASFLNIPIGARPAALGSAYSALASDAYAPVWNPGALGFVQSTQLAGQHLSYLESANDESLQFVHPFSSDSETPRQALGVSVQYLGSGDIPSTDNSGKSIGDFSSHYGSYGIAYGHKIGDTLSLGLAGKWINAKISDVSANAYAFDVGSLYRPTDNLS
jgi:hypothetical protein